MHAKKIKLDICINSSQDAEKYKLDNPRNFHYLNQSKTYELQGISSSEAYQKTRRAMDIVGITLIDQVYMHPSCSFYLQCYIYANLVSRIPLSLSL